jgi:hypothetical protein
MCHLSISANQPQPYQPELLVFDTTDVFVETRQLISALAVIDVPSIPNATSG